MHDVGVRCGVRCVKRKVGEKGKEEGKGGRKENEFYGLGLEERGSFRRMVQVKGVKVEHTDIRWQQHLADMQLRPLNISSINLEAHMNLFKSSSSSMNASPVYPSTNPLAYP